MIKTFGDRETARFYHGRGSIKRFPPTLRASAVRRLDMLNAAQKLEDLRSPPGNRLEALRGRWAGYSSIRINEQWRIVFRWTAPDAYEVRIIDYH